ncbi:uncharacterized protein LOC111321980 [Stylophora pistillata]|nr:uncharacterized protein LOC111321980 [Stylophora pistillata]
MSIRPRSWGIMLKACPILVVVMFMSIFKISTHWNKSYRPCEETRKLRENLAKELKGIHQQLQEFLLLKQGPSAKLAEQLDEIINKYDRRKAVDSVSDNDVILDVCPEVYNHGTNSSSLENGWVKTSCTNIKPLHSVVSVLVNNVAYPKRDEGHIETVIKGITETYPTIQVYLATGSDIVMQAAKKYENVHVIKVHGVNVAKVWNTLVRKASTPYVLVARDVFHFTWLTQLERQIRVISQVSYVEVAGGSYRNFAGHWKAGCVQTTMKNYAIKYQEGYLHSKNECMFCDYLQGPFVTKTNLFKLDEKLPNEVVFEDWFLTIIQKGSLAMSCPDAMYFTTDYWSYSKRNNRNVWTPLAKKWQLNRVIMPEGIKHSFSCKDIEVTCKPDHELLPLCCLKQYADALVFFQNFTEVHNLTFELDSGSTLGGIKFKSLVPWDIDGDLTFLCTGINIFGENRTVDYFQKNGYSLRGFEPQKQGGSHGYVGVYFNEFNIEVWGMADMTNYRYLPSELQKYETFTKANIEGYWIITSFSPGLFSRNRYGREILKHSQSWRRTGFQDSWTEYKPGSFMPCKKANGHGCLEDFPADGNIPFLVT